MTETSGSTSTPAASEPDSSSAARPRVDASKTPLFELLSGLTTGQWWKLGGTLFVIAIAVFGAGKWYEGLRRDAAITAAVAPKDEQIEHLSAVIKDGESAIKEREADIRGRDTSIAAYRSEIEMLGSRLTAAKGFIAFADKYLTYLASKDDAARKIFAGHICKLYRDSQQAEISGVTMNTSSVARTLADVTAPGSRELLIAAGYNSGLIDELIELKARGIQRNLPNISNEVGYEVAPIQPVTRSVQVSPGLQVPRITPQAGPDPQRVAAEVTKRLSETTPGQLVKVVTFHIEGRDYIYTMPPEIAGWVHNNPDCIIH